MSDLLETVIEAHGGLERWNQLDAVSVHGVNGGALWGLKGQAGPPGIGSSPDSQTARR